MQDASPFVAHSPQISHVFGRESCTMPLPTDYTSLPSTYHMLCLHLVKGCVWCFWQPSGCPWAFCICTPNTRPLLPPHKPRNQLGSKHQNTPLKESNKVANSRERTTLGKQSQPHLGTLVSPPKATHLSSMIQPSSLTINTAQPTPPMQQACFSNNLDNSPEPLFGRTP